MKILVLGHKGMLGRTVTAYLSTLLKHTIITTDTRFGNADFTDALTATDADYIINCIGKIPQKKPATDADYTFLNTDLPRFLETLGTPIIHPSTDCEFKGDIKPGQAYSKSDQRDADDVYGMSKANISAEIENSFKNTKIIRTSIIGHEETTALSLLDWFLNQNITTRGYTNHYWNGITTLQWAKLCQDLIENWDTYPTLNQFGTTLHHSKFDVLTMVKNIYHKEIEIVPFETEITVNKCLVSDKEIPTLTVQLNELKQFFSM